MGSDKKKQADLAALAAAKKQAAARQGAPVVGASGADNPPADIMAACQEAGEPQAGGGNASALRPVPRKSLADFKRDTDKRNMLIEGGWGKRGGTSMHVSTMGAGKSSLAMQSVLCFNRGVPCCGLRPVRPFTMWVIQSEDDEDRVAFDRDSVAEKLAAQYPDRDWNAAIRQTRFFDFTGITGANFIEILNNELCAVPPDEKPGGIQINPFNAFFGKDPCDHAACTAFWKGGELGRKETEGIEAVFRRHNVWGWFFGHTAQPPQTAKQLRDWMNDPYIAYKACGSSATPDALRSIITFLRVPDTDIFAFNAGKNGNGLGWTDANGKRTLRAFFQWSADGKHFWCDVPKDKWGEIDNRLKTYGASGGGGSGQTQEERALAFNAEQEKMRTALAETITNAGGNLLARHEVESKMLEYGFAVNKVKGLLKLLCGDGKPYVDQPELDRNSKSGIKKHGKKFYTTPELAAAYRETFQRLDV